MKFIVLGLLAFASTGLADLLHAGLPLTSGLPVVHGESAIIGGNAGGLLINGAAQGAYIHGADANGVLVNGAVEGATLYGAGNGAIVSGSGLAVESAAIAPAAITTGIAAPAITTGFAAPAITTGFAAAPAVTTLGAGLHGGYLAAPGAVQNVYAEHAHVVPGKEILYKVRTPAVVQKKQVLLAQVQPKVEYVATAPKHFTQVVHSGEPVQVRKHVQYVKEPGQLHEQVNLAPVHERHYQINVPKNNKESIQGAIAAFGASSYLSLDSVFNDKEKARKDSAYTSAVYAHTSKNQGSAAGYPALIPAALPAAVPAYYPAFAPAYYPGYSNNKVTLVENGAANAAAGAGAGAGASFAGGYSSSFSSGANSAAGAAAAEAAAAAAEAALESNKPKLTAAPSTTTLKLGVKV